MNVPAAKVLRGQPSVERGPKRPGDTLILAVLRRDAHAARQLIKEGVDVNFRDSEGMTALHHAAAIRERPCLRLLVNCGRCDYLIKDNKERYASELAIEWGDDAGVGLLLAKKQAMQAYQRNVPAWAKPHLLRGP